MAEHETIICARCKEEKMVTRELGGPIQLVCDSCKKAEQENEQEVEGVEQLVEVIEQFKVEQEEKNGSSYKKAKMEEKKRKYLAKLALLPLDKRIAKLEEQMYDHEREPRGYQFPPRY